jgi:hypothetical protein
MTGLSLSVLTHPLPALCTVAPGLRPRLGVRDHMGAADCARRDVALTALPADLAPHLGYAAARGLRPFGTDLLNRR